MSILIVDDHRATRDSLATLLGQSGYATVTAESGEAARAALAADTPDVLILDLTMPDQNGLEVLRDAAR